MSLFLVALTAFACGRACRPAGAWTWLPVAYALALVQVDLVLMPLSDGASGGSRALAAAVLFSLSGALSAARARRLGSVDARTLALAAAGGALLATALMAAQRQGPFAPGVGGLAWMQAAEGILVAVPLLWLGAAFVGSLSLVSRHAWSVTRPGFERLLALRYLVSREGAGVSKVTRVACLGVALGVWLVLVSVGILSGFEHDLLDKIVGTRGHLILARADGRPLPDGAAAAAHAWDAGGAEVAAAAPFVEAPVAVVSELNYGGGELLALDPMASGPVLASLSSLSPAARQALAPGHATPQVVLGVELARNLSVRAGDRVRLVLPTEETLTPLGPVPRSLSVEVADVWHSGMYEADSRLVLASLPLGRRLLAWDARSASGVHLRSRAPGRVEALAKRLRGVLAAAFGGEATAESFVARNKTLFAALALERVVAFVVLAFVVLVASFSVVNTLTMAIWQRRHEVAMLKAMGATNGSLLLAFLLQGAFVGLAGTAIGTGLGLGTLWALGRRGFGIPYEVYYVDALPVHVGAEDVIFVVAGSLLVLWTFSLLPSQAGSRVPPVEALRDG